MKITKIFEFTGNPWLPEFTLDVNCTYLDTGTGTVKDKQHMNISYTIT